MSQDFGENHYDQTPWDYVVLASVLEAVDDPLPLLKAVRRGLRASGEAYITTLCRWYNGKGPMDTQARFYTPAQLTRAIHQADMDVTRMLFYGNHSEYLICWTRRQT